jgi:hypothetical protein
LNQKPKRVNKNLRPTNSKLEKRSFERDGSKTLGLVSQKRKNKKQKQKFLSSNQRRSSGQIIITSISIIPNLKFESKES